MPRGRKKVEENLTLEEQLMNIQREISNLTENLKALKTKKKEIQDKIAEREKEEVYQTFLRSGKSIEDLKILLSENEPVIESIEKE